jgi:hypothetical protein
MQLMLVLLLKYWSHWLYINEEDFVTENILLLLKGNYNITSFIQEL